MSPHPPQRLNERPCKELSFFFMGKAFLHPSQIFLLLAGAISPQWSQHLKERPCRLVRFFVEAFVPVLPVLEAIWLDVDIIWTGLVIV